MRWDRSSAIKLLLMVGAALGLGICSQIMPLEFPAPRARAVAPVRPSITDHVVVISVDGLRPDAIDKFNAVTIKRLMRQGSYALDAKTILPSLTLPSHTSMLTGKTPENHGVTWNQNEAGRGFVQVPTIFSRARESGLRTAAFLSKGKFHHLIVPGTLDHVDVPEGNSRWPAEQTVANVTKYLAKERPNVMFIHLGEPDYGGHSFGWMSWRYGQAVRKADAAVARVLQASERAFGAGNYTVILTADHGGSGRTHGSADPRDVTIPWIAWGAGVRTGTVLSGNIRTMDTAATALWLLGVPNLAGETPVRDAFVPQHSALQQAGERSCVTRIPQSGVFRRRFNEPLACR